LHTVKTKPVLFEGRTGLKNVFREKVF